MFIAMVETFIWEMMDAISIEEHGLRCKATKYCIFGLRYIQDPRLAASALQNSVLSRTSR